MININLLPPEKQEFLAQSKKNARALKNLKIVVTLLVVSLIAYSIPYSILYLKTKEITTKERAAEDAIKPFAPLENKAKKSSEKITAVKNIMAANNNWPKLISELQKITPTGVTFSSLSIEADSKLRQSVSGDADSKKAVAALRDAMEASPLFEYVNIESDTTTASSKDAKAVENFNLSYSITKGAFK